MYGGFFGGCLGSVASAMLYMAYDKAYIAANQENTDATTAGYINAAQPILDELELTLTKMTALQVLVGIELWEQGTNWMAAQTMLLNKSKKEE